MLERVEIIDLKPREALYETWEPFISYHHYDCRSSFYETYVANYPRRSGEALFIPSTQGRAAEQFPVPRQADFADLYSWLEPIARYEREREFTKNDGTEVPLGKIER